MKNNHFYFLRNEYFVDFPDDCLMKNREMVDGVLHDRPCYFSFPDIKNPQIFWMVPFSSKTEKFHRIYDNKVKKRGKCDTIVFADILGVEKAFLIQNMCPVLKKYIKNEYIAETGPVRLSHHKEQEIQKKAIHVLSLVEKGYKNLVFPDIMKIKSELMKDI